MKKLTIAFDIDGVLRNLVAYTVAKMDPPRKPEDITTYGGFVRLFKDKDQWRAFLEQIGAWRKSPVHNAMRNLFYELRDTHGFDCIIVTSNSHYDGQSGTLNWLRNNLTVQGVDVHFVNEKTRVQFDAIIEDMPTNAFKAAKDGRLAFLVKRPWSGVLEANKGHEWMKRVVQLPADDEALLVVLRELAYWQKYAMKEEK